MDTPSVVSRYAMNPQDSHHHHHHQTRLPVKIMMVMLLLLLLLMMKKKMMMIAICRCFFLFSFFGGQFCVIAKVAIIYMKI